MEYDGTKIKKRTKIYVNFNTAGDILPIIEDSDEIRALFLGNQIYKLITLNYKYKIKFLKYISRK